MSPREREIVRLLADGQPRSGEVIAAAVGISRTAVWKILHKLDAELGLELESVRGQGYRLPEPMELLSPELILSEIDAPTQRQIAMLEVLDEVESTNAYLLDRGRMETHLGDRAGSRFNSAAICLAERQSAGRGRLGRNWVSPFGRNIYLSILWRYPLAPAQLGGLSLACGVEVASVLERLGAEGVGLKWPNDIHWQRRKLGGLLLEVVGEAQGPSLVVVGVGLNLLLRSTEAAAIDQPWVDLSEVCGDSVPARNRLAAALIESLTAALSCYAGSGLAPFLGDWRRFDIYRGERVTLLSGERQIEGVLLGIDDQGCLLLDAPNGRQCFAAGEVSLRPVGSR